MSIICNYFRAGFLDEIDLSISPYVVCDFVYIIYNLNNCVIKFITIQSIGMSLSSKTVCAFICFVYMYRFYI